MIDMRFWICLCRLHGSSIPRLVSSMTLRRCTLTTPISSPVTNIFSLTYFTTSIASLSSASPRVIVRMCFCIFRNNFACLGVCQLDHSIPSYTNKHSSIRRKLDSSTRSLVSFCMPLSVQGSIQVIFIAVINTANTESYQETCPSRSAVASRGLLGCNAIANTSEGNSIPANSVKQLTESQQLFVQKRSPEFGSRQICGFFSTLKSRRRSDQINHRGTRCKPRLDRLLSGMGNAASKAPKAVRNYPSPSTLPNHSPSTNPTQTNTPFPRTLHPADARARREGKDLRKER